MKPAIALVAAIAMTGAAHAEQFDLVCATLLTVEIKDRPSSTMDQEMRFSLDTDARTIRQHGFKEGPFPLTIHPDRYTFEVRDAERVFDRATNKLTSTTTTSLSKMSLAGDCKKEAYTPAP